MTTISDYMTTEVVSCPSDATISDAARLMRDRDIGDVLVVDDNALRGIVTDRDLVVRCLAAGAAADATLGEVCSSAVTTVAPDADVTETAGMMREHALRRLPVVDDGQLVGIVTIGDLAVERDPNSALGAISAAPPNN